MAMTTATPKAPFGAGPLTSIFQRGRALIAQIEADAHMDRLKDRDLADVGLTRVDRLGTRYSMFAARAL